LGIDLYTSLPDVHIGDTIYYSVLVANAPFPACDAGQTNPASAGAIQAFVVTPDGVTNNLTLRRTFLAPGDSDYYTNVVSYVVRAQDLRSDGTVRATASDEGDIWQNATLSRGGGNQGVNTMVNMPCVRLIAQCVGGVGENGAITFTGTVTNCGNDTLVGVTVTNFNDSGFYTVLFPTNLAIGQVATFSGSWVPLNACVPSTAILTVLATDQFTATPRTVTSSNSITCQNTLTAGIKVTKACPAQPVSPGQLLTFSGSVSNTGNVTLTNIVVVNNQPTPSTPVFTLASLAPGALANFTGSYPAPTNCSVTDTLIARAESKCGVAVTNTVSATCPITTTPQIAVTAACPTTPVLPGGSLTYSGTVRNAGNIALTNVVVVSSRPAPNTTVFTAAALAPGASANFTGTYSVPTNACSVATTFSGTGQDLCGAITVTNTISTTCTVTTAPAIAVTLACPAVPAAAGGLISYTGTVRNSGNVTLDNVTVVDNQAVPSTVLTVPSLAPGASANFSASFTAPTGECSVSSTVTASGSDDCMGTVVNNSASATCTLVTTPRIVLTQNCPTTSASLGELLTYSGTVSNAGNITLTNVAVVNNLSGTTPVFTAATLAAGAAVSFTGSYMAPTNCSSTSISTATGRSTCGAAVTNTVSTTCPVLTAPQITVTAVCPATPVLPGGLLTYSGTVRNSGNITVTNVVVVSDRPAPNTTVLKATKLAPGASTNFTGTYTVPANACSVTTTFSGTGKGICTGTAVTNTVSTTCAVTTAPAIAVTLACPAVSASAGGLVTYSGTVRNTGDVTLNNVFVVNSQPAPNTPVIGPLTLAPGASNKFTASFTAPINACSVSSTVTATGSDNCTAVPVTNTASATCPLITTPGIMVTEVCPVSPAIPGGLLTYRGAVTNTGNITLTNVVVVNSLSGATPVFTIATLAPGAGTNFTGSYLAPTNCSSTSTSTATGRSICGVAVTNTASATCPILMAPQIAVTAICPATPVSPGGLLTYSGTVRNTGNFTLTNVVVVSSRPAPNTPVFTAATLAAGASANFTGAYTVPANACSVTTTFSATARDLCAISTVTNTVSTTCTVTTSPAIAVTLACPAAPLSAGGLVTYSGTVRNTGDVTLNNVFVVNSQPAPNTPVIGPLTLAPGASNNFTVSLTAPTNACSVSSTVTATGSDNCTAATVANTASATCPLNSTPSLVVTEVCPATPVIPGGLLTYSGTVTNTGNITLTNVDVLNNLSGTTPVLTLATLAPGAGTNFTGSFMAPTNCSVTSISTATGWSACGVAVTNTVSSTCPILGAPAIVVTQACPLTPPVQGGTLTYSGSVSNAGSVTLSNIVVVNNWPVSGTVVFTAASLAPHAMTNFTGSYMVPGNCCVAWLTLEARGQGCDGAIVTDTDTGTCTVFTSPRIVVTKVCAPGVLRPGDLLTYSGIVSNAGNITLINVTVVNNQPGAGSALLGPIDLAPGQSVPYTASYIVPNDFCGNDTVTASGLDVCGYAPVADSVTATCPVTTTPLIGVTKQCPAQPTPHGGQLVFSGTLTNLGNVTLVNVTVVNDQPSNNTPVIGPITLAPGAFINFTGSYTAPLVCCEITDTLTARGQDRCSGSNVIATATAVCPTLYTPGIALVQNCPPKPLPMGSLYSFSGFVTNTGDAILTNVVVFSRQPGQNPPLLGPLDLAPGQSEQYSGSMTVASNICEVIVSATSQETCKGAWVTNTTACPVATTPLLAITQNCPANPVNPGGLLTYNGTVSNAGNITLTNVVVLNDQSGATPVFTAAMLAPGAAANFTGSYVAPTNATTTSTSTAAGQTLCGVAVTSTVSATCSITMPLLLQIKGAPTAPHGFFSLSFSSENGKSYRVQYKSASNGPTWTDLETVVGTGGTMTLTNLAAAQQTRFYRVISTP
jgi:uncharacterized repeat protein (TIGR01451 family)